MENTIDLPPVFFRNSNNTTNVEHPLTGANLYRAAEQRVIIYGYTGVDGISNAAGSIQIDFDCRNGSKKLMFKIYDGTSWTTLATWTGT